MSSTSEIIIETGSRIKIPVSVILQRAIDRSKKWGYPSWSVWAVIAGENIDTAREQMLVHQSEDTVRHYHGGLMLELFKDGSEGYWYNLLSEEPYLFVICEGEQGAMEIEPVFITANQDEATGHLESDDIVLSVPMPGEIRELLERYVTDHYAPAIRKKRKRKDWLDDSLYVNKSGQGDVPAVKDPGKPQSGTES